MNSSAASVIGLDRPCQGSSTGAVILPPEGDALLVERDEPAVGDGDAVGVAGEIGEHRLGPAKGRLA